MTSKKSHAEEAIAQYKKKYPNAYKLDEYEQDIEDNCELRFQIPNMEERLAMMQRAAILYNRNKRKSITLRVHERDLESMRVNASKLGVPYQTYINMLIHQDAIKSAQ